LIVFRDVVRALQLQELARALKTLPPKVRVWSRAPRRRGEIGAAWPPFKIESHVPIRRSSVSAPGAATGVGIIATF
jgi:hypothetical protein